MSPPIALCLCLAALLGVKTLAQTCVSYGVDVQDGGSYFQNVSSTDPFTFASIFEGCQADVVYNILVDPTGDQYQCSDTSLTPADAVEVATCPLDKDQLYSGDWSVLIISNDGDGDPIAYERDFTLSVGVPSTVTYIPTVTAVIPTTPIVNITQTSTFTNIITTTVIVTSPAVTETPTVTSTPQKVTVTTTKTDGTISRTKWTVSPTVFTRTHTASCTVSKRQPYPDPTCTITPTIISAAALQTSAAKAKFRRIKNRSVIVDKEQWLVERKARLANRRLNKRTLDQAITTITDTNTADYITSTIFSTVSTSTMTITAVVTVTTTSKTTSTSYSGTTTVRAVTITAPTPTVTKTKHTVTTTTVATNTRIPTVYITTTYISGPAATACAAKGGKMW